MNDTSHDQVFIVPIKACGQRADVVLADLLPAYSRSQLSRWLKEGTIVFLPRSLRPKDKVVGGEQVVVKKELVGNKTYDDLPEPIVLDIIHEDDSLLVINKPAGLVVHPGAGNWQHTLLNALLHHEPRLQELPRAGIIHRLDKNTTGLLMIAKTLTAYTALVRQLQAREVERCYLALVRGHMVSGGLIQTYYGRHPKNRLKMAVTSAGKEAITEYRVKKHYKVATLLDVKLYTGRTHQIRVHMAHLHHPIIGDMLYGGTWHLSSVSEKLRHAIQSFKRQALHAYTLAFVHPLTNTPLLFSAPLPDDYRYLMDCFNDEHV